MAFITYDIGVGDGPSAAPPFTGLPIFSSAPYDGRSFASPDTIRSWVTQRISNRYPIWSRARQEMDSMFQLLVNTGAQDTEEMYFDIIQNYRDHYVQTVSTTEQEFLHVLWLPQDFEFNYETNEGGKFTYYPPTVTGTIGSTDYSVNILDPNKSYMMDVNRILPTRLSATKVATGATNTIVASTNISSASSATINDDQLDNTGVVFIEIDGATLFGSRDERNIPNIPKVIIVGTPKGHKDTLEEHIIFLYNGIKRSRYSWESIDSIDVRGIEGASATVEITAGFLRESISNPYLTTTTPLDEYPTLHSFATLNIVSGLNTYYLPFIQHKTFEVNDLSLQRQGIGSFITEHEFGLLKSSGEFYSEELVDIEMLPNTKWIAAVTPTELLFIDSRLPHPISETTLDSNDDTMIGKMLKDRTSSPEMRIMVDQHDPVCTETWGETTFTTWQKKRTRAVESTRLSITIESAEVGPVTYYYDWDGTQLNILTHPTGGWIYNSDYIPANGNTINSWLERSISFDIPALAKSYFWTATCKLEVSYNDGNTETDVTLVYSPFRTPEKTISLPSGLRNNVAGLSIDKDQSLVLLTSTNEIWKMSLLYDYYLIDYQRNKLWFMEEYDSIEVTV